MSDSKLKFKDDSTTEPLTVVSAGQEENQFGSKMVVRIKQTIEGYDYFEPSTGLERKMKEENIDVGDIITIEKVGPSEKYQYGYFNVKVVEKNKNKPPMHESVKKFEKQFEEKVEEQVAYGKGFGDGGKTAAVDNHELNVRVEKIETIVATLWTDYSNRTGDAGHKEGDDKLPF